MVVLAAIGCLILLAVLISWSWHGLVGLFKLQWTSEQWIWFAIWATAMWFFGKLDKIAKAIKANNAINDGIYSLHTELYKLRVIVEEVANRRR